MRHSQFKKPAGERRDQANDSPALANAPRLGLRASGEGFSNLPQTDNDEEICHGYESEMEVVPDPDSGVRLAGRRCRRAGPRRQARAPPPPPPVLYNIQFWTVPQIGQLINEMNTYGQVVGKCWTSVDTGEAHGYLYDPLVNIDENPDGIAIATDLNTCAVSGIPEGLMIASANGINDHGIVRRIPPTEWISL